MPPLAQRAADRSAGPPECSGAYQALMSAAAQQERYERRLELDAHVHLALAFPAVGEVDGQFNDLQAVPDRPVVHLHLEAVAVAADAGHVDGFQGGAAPDLESGGDVADTQVQ